MAATPGMIRRSTDTSWSAPITRRTCWPCGWQAARRVPALLDSGADVVIISPELSPQLAEFAAGGRIRWTQRGYAPGDCAGAWLVGACTSDPNVNSAVADEADAAGIWCVRADDAAASRAWTPASGAAGGGRGGRGGGGGGGGAGGGGPRNRAEG